MERRLQSANGKKKKYNLTWIRRHVFIDTIQSLYRYYSISFIYNVFVRSKKRFLPQDRSAQLAQVKARSLALVFVSLLPGKTTKFS